jgi:uncharacterized protein (DUF1684 family)
MVLVGCSQERQAAQVPLDYTQQIEQSRRIKDQFLRENPGSPWPAQQRSRFQGLIYFPVDPGYRLAGHLIPYAKQESVQMLTTQGTPDTYTRYGYIDFAIEGQPCRLTVYTTHVNHRLHYFLPFKDATNGQETYSVGRYVEIEVDAKGKVILDFNLAYNPYCAYNHDYTCPIPPRENYLKVAIRAGEKKPKADS